MARSSLSPLSTSALLTSTTWVVCWGGASWLVLEAGLMGEDGEEGDDRDLDKEAGTFTSLLRLGVYMSHDEDDLSASGPHLSLVVEGRSCFREEEENTALSGLGRSWLLAAALLRLSGSGEQLRELGSERKLSGDRGSPSLMEPPPPRPL